MIPILVSLAQVPDDPNLAVSYRMGQVLVVIVVLIAVVWVVQKIRKSNS